ncbi:MAG: hypothetical protein KBA51_08445 [Kiritimatiellae bacterium]|nr:hypothetical protein [Kiritimatiellia bacterium]
MRTFHAFISAAMMLAVTTRGWAAGNSDEAALLSAYYHYGFAQTIGEQCAAMGADLPAGKAEEIKAVAADWVSFNMDGIRQTLETRFPNEARDRFERFVTMFSAALRDQDTETLEAVAQAISPGGRADETLMQFKQEALAGAQEQAAQLLGEVQTWADLARQGTELPPLESWLMRSEPPDGPASPTPPPPPPPSPSRKRNPLAEAEAAPTEFVNDPDAGDEGNALESFAAMRKARREQVLADAQAGMQQVAQERQAAETEYAAKKTAAAQAEAEAMKAHAQKLAAAETEALEQRKNSWSSRLKNIVSSTVGAAVGAFTGGIGAEAGQRAVQEIFR